jgi:IS1 family transposase
LLRINDDYIDYDLETKIKFEIHKMRAIFKSFWVRKLIGKLGVPYNRTLGVRGSSHPLKRYDADLSLPAAESKAFRIQPVLPCPSERIASLSCLASTGVKRAAYNSPLAFCFPTFGRPAFFFIIIVNKYIDSILISVNNYYKLNNAMANILKTEKKIAVISMLCEGMSIRAVERITGVQKKTIGRLALRVGEACAKIQDEKMRGLTCKNIEVDEIWGFIGAKRKNAAATGNYGDVWTFIALDADTKLIPSFIVGKRDAYHARAFMEDLARRLALRVQLSSDALPAYPDAIERGFGSEVDYGQLVKTYGVTNLNKDAASRYSPAEVVKTERTIIAGMPDVSRITTSHIEKQNHTLRMHCRRLTRLTNAFSRKIENFEAAVSLNFAYYNFCKIHGSIRMTPAMAAGVEKSIWTVADLIKFCGE